MGENVWRRDGGWGYELVEGGWTQRRSVWAMVSVCDLNH